MNTLEPIYAATVEAVGWSPAELNPPFDLESFIAASYTRPTDLDMSLATVVKTARKRQRA